MQMKANRKRNEVKLTASKPNRANRNQTEDWLSNNLFNSANCSRSVQEVEYH